MDIRANCPKNDTYGVEVVVAIPGEELQTLKLSGESGKSGAILVTSPLPESPRPRVKNKKVKINVLIKLAALVGILLCFMPTLVDHKLRHHTIWGFEIWKWSVLLIMISSGMIIMTWVVHLIIYLLERNSVLNEKVLYFIQSSKNSCRVVIWLGAVLLTWVLLFQCEVEQSTTTTMVLTTITRTLAAILIGAILWFLKTLLLKLFAYYIYRSRFFDRILDSMVQAYALQIFWKYIVNESSNVSYGGLNFRSAKMKKWMGKESIDIVQLYHMKQEYVSPQTIKVLVDVITSSYMINGSVDDRGDGQTSNAITNEMDIVNHICPKLTHTICLHIVKELMTFMTKEAVDVVLPQFERQVTGGIEINALKVWLVKFHNERQTLARALRGSKKVLKQLKFYVRWIVIVFIILSWFLLMKIATMKDLAVFLSLLLLAISVLGTLQCINFVFVMHQFDVGDRCQIDDDEMVVEEINILTTNFLKDNNDKISYHNSILSRKAISNYNRSPNMDDHVDLFIDLSTPEDSIEAFKHKIKKYLEENPHHWRSTHRFVTDLMDTGKLKMILFVTHTTNFQDYLEIQKRRSSLVMELKRLLLQLHIKNNLPPQEDTIA